MKSYPLFAGLLLSLFFVAFANQQLHAAQNDDFGRLFTSQSERTKLDNLRQSQQLKLVKLQEPHSTEDSTEANIVEVPDPIALQGYVKRNDGTKSTLWINNKAVQEDSSVDNVQIGKLNHRGFSSKAASTEGIDLKIPANGKQVRLKAGQMYEPETNQIVELQVVEKAKRLNLEGTGVIDDAQLRVGRVGKKVE